MAYVLIENGVVAQKQPNAQKGFIQAPEDVVCGFLYDGNEFSAPVIVPKIKKPSDLDIRLAALEAKVGITEDDKIAAKEALIQDTQLIKEI